MRESSKEVNLKETSGLKANHIQLLVDIISASTHVESITLFGSRAMGTFSESSDIDLALEGEHLTLTDLGKIKSQIEQTSIPYQVDLLIKHKVTNLKLIEHIDNYGVVWHLNR